MWLLLGCLVAVAGAGRALAPQQLFGIVKPASGDVVRELPLAVEVAFNWSLLPAAAGESAEICLHIKEGEMSAPRDICFVAAVGVSGFQTDVATTAPRSKVTIKVSVRQQDGRAPGRRAVGPAGGGGTGRCFATVLGLSCDFGVQMRLAVPGYGAVFAEPTHFWIDPEWHVLDDVVIRPPPRFRLSDEASPRVPRQLPPQLPPSHLSRNRSSAVACSSTVDVVGQDTWLSYLHENGYAIIRDVATPEEVRVAERLLWRFLEGTGWCCCPHALRSPAGASCIASRLPRCRMIDTAAIDSLLVPTAPQDSG